MLLNLLRVEQLGVEDMLRRSFAECGMLRKVLSHKEQLRTVESNLAETELPDCEVCRQGALLDYFQNCREYLRTNKRVWKALSNHQAVIKALTGGRILIISHGESLRNRIALLVRSTQFGEGQKKMFTVLVPLSEGEEVDGEMSEESEVERRMLWDLASGANEVSAPEPAPEAPHALLEISEDEVVGISSKQMKANTSSIVEDWEKRQQPRFR